MDRAIEWQQGKTSLDARRMPRGDRQGHRVRVGARSMALGASIKSGGAGTIYRLPDAPDQVAKIYHPHIERGEYAHKIEAMLELAPRLPAREFRGETVTQIAWPQDKIFDRGSRFIGFAMPLLDMGSTEELELMLQARQARAAGLNPTLGVKMTLAANLASVISSLHRQKHYLVDLKPVNLRFYRDSLYIALLDCDGFSVQGRSWRFPAEQFTPDYLAPEFQGRGVKPGKGREQDLFALAVIVFRLVNFGIHPFTGKPADDRVPTDIPARIRGWLYAYGRQPHPQLAPSPVSAHEAMPRELRDLFDRAFASTDRPSAAAWADALSVYARRDSGRIVVCSKDDAHQHFAGQPCGAAKKFRYFFLTKNCTYRMAELLTLATGHDFESPRECRRLVGLSHAASADSVSVA
jgi:DNA-binding helix-hairpin-helix protein with protein kinase domain